MFKMPPKSDVKNSELYSYFLEFLLEKHQKTNKPFKPNEEFPIFLKSRMKQSEIELAEIFFDDLYEATQLKFLDGGYVDPSAYKINIPKDFEKDKNVNDFISEADPLNDLINKSKIDDTKKDDLRKFLIGTIDLLTHFLMKR